MKDVTLKDQGAKLPIGIVDDNGVLHKDFTVKRWTAKQERELGKLRQENKSVSMAEHIALVLTVLCEKIGPYNFLEMKKLAERRLAVSQMFSGDVFYVYCYLRCKALGSSLGFEVECPFCGTKYSSETDLMEMTSAVADKLDDTIWEYKLLEPFLFRDAEAKTLTIGQTYWHSIEEAEVEGSLDIEGGKMAMLAGAIRGVKEFPVEVAPILDELDEMDKKDIVKIVDEMNEHHFGPDMRLITKCPKCKSENVQPINWGYQSFFGSSSLSRTRGNSSSKSLQQPTSQKEPQQ
jgi:hypothetical protein